MHISVSALTAGCGASAKIVMQHVSMEKQVSKAPDSCHTHCTRPERALGLGQARTAIGTKPACVVAASRNPCSATGIHLDLHPGFGQAYRTQTITDKTPEEKKLEAKHPIKGFPRQQEFERAVYLSVSFTKSGILVGKVWWSRVMLRCQQGNARTCQQMLHHTRVVDHPASQGVLVVSSVLEENVRPRRLPRALDDG
jgi:hypothetical protein